MIGLMSTPNAGGTTFRVTIKKGSVGQAIIFAGSLFTSIWGYHDKTMRIKKATPPRSRIGSVIALAGPAQAGASARRRGVVEAREAAVEGSRSMVREVVEWWWRWGMVSLEIEEEEEEGRGDRKAKEVMVRQERRRRRM